MGNASNKAATVAQRGVARSDARADGAWIALRNASSSARRFARRRRAASTRRRVASFAARAVRNCARSAWTRRATASSVFARPAATASASTSGGRAGAASAWALQSASARLACARRARDAASPASTQAPQRSAAPSSQTEQRGIFFLLASELAAAEFPDCYDVSLFHSSPAPTGQARLNSYGSGPNRYERH